MSEAQLEARLHSGLHSHLSDYSPIYYVMRLVAYGLIAVAIVQKNLRPAE